MSRRAGSERGSAAVFVIGFSIVLFVAAGLVIDGGLALNARMKVADDAEQASRVGADSIDVEELRLGGDVVVDADLAQGRATDFLRTVGYGPGEYAVSVDGNDVRVVVSDTVRTGLLGLVGIHRFDVRASAVSSPETQ